MANITWKTATSGDFNTGTNWNGGNVPGASDDADINATGANYTVTTSQGNTVQGIETSSNATFVINNGVRTFTATNGTDGGANAGTIDVNDNASFAVGGTVNNTGTINLLSGGNDTELDIASGGATLTGSGSVVLSNNGNNFIEGTGTLTNVNNTISGGGNIGRGGSLGLTNEASGVIDANVSNTLTIQSTVTASNAGLFEATNAATLYILNTTIANAGGTIEGNGGNVSLQGAVIQGGTLNTTNGGAITTVSGDRTSTLVGSTTAVTNEGTLTVHDNSSLTIAGTISNTGSITLSSGGNSTQLDIASGGATLAGGGTVVLSNNGNNFIEGGTLTNVNNTISGGGDIGAGGAFNFTNEASGVVDANVSNTLTLWSSGTVSNAGVLEASSGGTLLIDSTKISNTTLTGKIETNGGGTIKLQSADIVGGILNDTTGGTIETVDRGSTLDSTVSSNKVLILGSLNVQDNTSLTIDGTINLLQKVGKTSTTGTIDLSSGGNETQLIAGVKSATLEKGGFVSMSDNASNTITGTLTQGGKSPHFTYKLSTLTNDATISGAGIIDEVILKNAGTIDATGNNALIIETGDSRVTKSSIVTNTGILEATAGSGGLHIVNTTVTGLKGKVEALNGSNVDLQSATIQGGTLITGGGSVIQTLDRGSTLDGSNTTAGAIKNTGTVKVQDNTSLTIAGTISNTGSIALSSGGNNTQLDIASVGATLTGGGTVSLSNNNNNFIEGAGTLTNVNNTISGSGNIGVGTAFNFTNEASGVVDADVSSALTIQSSGTVSNAGVIEATSSGTLDISSTTIANAGGTIVANGGAINLGSADIEGGTLNTTNGGTITTTDRGSTLDGSTNAVTNEGTVTIHDNTSLTIAGTISNTGSISMASGGNSTQLDIASGGATLTGSGTVVMSNNNNNFIEGAGTLTNVNNTISGSGNIGVGSAFNFTNEASGVVNADVSSALTIQSSGTVSNAGVIEATSSGTLDISSTTIANAGGTIVANGGAINLGSADIQGGTLNTTNSGTITTTDRGSILDGTTNAVDNEGTVTIRDNTSLTIAGTISNTGSITLSSGGNSTQLDIASGGATLAGGGTVVLSNNNSNNFIEGAGTLTNDNTIEGGGQLGNGAIGIVNNGTILANTSTALNVNTSGSSVTNNGVLSATGSGTLNVAQAVTGTGHATIGNGGTLNLESSFTQNVTFTGATNAATGLLELADTLGTSYTGTISGVQLGDSGEKILLNDLSFVTGASAVYNTSNDELTVTSGTNSSTFRVTAASGNFSANSFSVANVGGKVEVFDPGSAGSLQLLAQAGAGMSSISGSSSSTGIIAPVEQTVPSLAHSA